MRVRPCPSPDQSAQERPQKTPGRRRSNISTFPNSRVCRRVVHVHVVVGIAGLDREGHVYGHPAARLDVAEQGHEPGDRRLVPVPFELHAHLQLTPACGDQRVQLGLVRAQPAAAAVVPAQGTGLQPGAGLRLEALAAQLGAGEQPVLVVEHVEEEPGPGAAAAAEIVMAVRQVVDLGQRMVTIDQAQGCRSPPRRRPARRAAQARPSALSTMEMRR